MTIFNNQARLVKIEKITRGNAPYLNVLHIPQTGPLAGKEIGIGNFITNLNPETIDTLKSLAEGEAITLKVEQPEGTKFRNLIGVTRGVDKNVQKTHKKFAKASSNDYNDRAAKGQALNLAMQVAVVEGRHHDTDYIMSLVPKMLKLGEDVQNGIGVKLQTTTRAVQEGTQEKTTKTTSKAPTGGQGSAPSASMGPAEVDDFEDLFNGDL